MKNPQYTDPDFQKLFAQIAPEIADTFNGEQLEAIRRSFCSHAWTRHPLDIRLSVPIPRLKFYLVLLAGSERRSQLRLRYQKRLYPFWTPANILFLMGFSITLLACIYTIFSFALSSATPIFTSDYPTSISWIYEQAECKHTSRI
ncbi:hypothetical protein WKK05_38440 (plasmid) [Nostoc sp. UHCC 0302]|uniref:hypothetical protein n=1 Tax=Nostoc sp. UHCC 0302 TaxID=3134896 RepID=UPI00311CDBF8